MKKSIWLSILVASILLVVTLQKTRTEDLYMKSVGDATEAEVSEILPLVTLTKDSDMVTWHEDGERVLLLSWHSYPESYVAGEDFECVYGEIWTFTDKEIAAWYEEHAVGVEDWNLRLEQLIGLPKDSGYTHVSAFWVDLEDVVRPAYQPDVTEQMTEELLDSSALGELKEWFLANIEYSYSEETPYPWTRLGYTYDWAEGSSEYGLSEFLIQADSVIEVEWTKTTEEFIGWLENYN